MASASPNPARRAVLITGASSGIGAASARVLVERGFRVWAGVRNDDAAARLRELGEHCTPIVLDVTDAGQIAAAATIANDGGLYGLVNNAGIAVGAPLEAIPLAALREQFEINVFGALAVTQAMLPLLRRTRGRIVMISSVQGRLAAPFVGPYAASKHALEALSDSLRAELLPSGVDVAIIEPGAVKTPIWERSAKAGSALGDAMDPEQRARYADEIAMMLRVSEKFAARGIAPERVADAIAHALTARKPRTRYVVGFDAKVRVTIGAIVPDRARDRLLRATLKRIALRPD
jgi:NAD(P)-dependent dehydrogenase (short-subunit alcohol dehydrogenase family)